jgi:hypothetical protein
VEQRRWRAGSGAAVVARRSAGRAEQYLCAYLTAHRRLAARDLRAALRRDLPAYLVPSVIVQLEALPLNRNGKVDRAALAAMDPADLARTAQPTDPADVGSAADVGSVADVGEPPGSSMERVLAGIWLDLLPTDDLGVTESVFLAGADSLLAMRAAGIMHDVFRTPVPVRALFEHASVRQQVAYLRTTCHRADVIADRLLELASAPQPI